MSIVIVDYGMGNLRSVLNKVKRVTPDAVISSKPEDVLHAERLILPGVGHFGKAIEQIRKRNLYAALDVAVREKHVPILGICLGMQLLTRHSEEGDVEGFGWIDATTKRFRFEDDASSLKLPHIGWNHVHPSQNNILFHGMDGQAASFYFVHSYHVDARNPADVAAKSRYGYDFDCALHRQNVFGTQFHPEKSHGVGMQMLANFLEDGADTIPVRGSRSREVDSGMSRPDANTTFEARSGAAQGLPRPRIIPCLLLRGQGLVKTVKFKNPKYVGDPINAVRIFNTKEVDELIFLDITATREGRGPNLKAVANIAEESDMPLTIGGGVRSVEHIRQLLNAGAEKVAINTAGIETPQFIRDAADIFGSQCIVAAIDVRRRWTGRYEVSINAGSKSTGREPVDVAKEMERFGAGEILLNSIERDGTMQGYDEHLIRNVSDAVNVPVIASGGAGSAGDLVSVIDNAGASAAAAGSLFVFHGPRRAVLISFPTREQLSAARAA